MIIQFFLLSTVVLVAALISTFLVTAIRSRIALVEARRRFKNTPIMPDAGWLSNHLFEFYFGQNWKKITFNHLRYGENVLGLLGTRISLSSIDLDLIKRIVIDSGEKTIDRIDMKAPMKEFEVDNIFFVLDQQWRRIRRSFAPPFRPQRYNTFNVKDDFEITINKLIAAIEDKLSDGNGSRGCTDFDVEDLMHRLSMDIKLSTLYKQHNLINFNLNEHCQWVKTVESGYLEFDNNLLIQLSFVVPAIRRLVDFLSYHFHPSGKWRKDVMKFLKTQAKVSLEARKQLEEMHRLGVKVDNENSLVLKDGSRFERRMIDDIIDRMHSGFISQNEYLNSSFSLFMAADKTNSDSLSYTFYQLAQNETIQEKLRTSIKIHGRESEYLSWVINESLRLNPPAPIGCSRTLSEDVKLDNGDVLPAGSLLVTPLLTIHRYKKYWGEDAEEFRPERFSEADKFHPCQFMPFGAGLRICLGKDYALLEMKMVICALLARYKFGPLDKNEELEFSSPFLAFIFRKEPLRVSISRLEIN